MRTMNSRIGSSQHSSHRRSVDPAAVPRLATTLLIMAQKAVSQLPVVRPLQVFYYLGELDSALSYALGAGTLFDVNEQSEYVQTLIGEQHIAAQCWRESILQQ